MLERVAAIIVSSNIGTHLIMKMIKHRQNMESAAFAGIDAASEGWRWPASTAWRPRLRASRACAR